MLSLSVKASVTGTASSTADNHNFPSGRLGEDYCFLERGNTKFSEAAQCDKTVAHKETFGGTNGVSRELLRAVFKGQAF